MFTPRAFLAFIVTLALCIGVGTSALRVYADPASERAAYERGRAESDAELKKVIIRMQKLVVTQKQDSVELNKAMKELVEQIDKIQAEMERRTKTFEAVAKKAEEKLAAEVAEARRIAMAVIRTTKGGGVNGGDHPFASEVGTISSFEVKHGKYVNSIRVNGAPFDEKTSGGRQEANSTPPGSVTLHVGETIVSGQTQTGDDNLLETLVMNSSEGRTWTFGRGGGAHVTTWALPKGDEWRGVSGLAGDVLMSIDFQSGLKK